jgi:hypothetical protein
MIDKETREECTAFILEQIRETVAAFGPRASGSSAENRAQEYMRDLLEKESAGEVRLEKFRLAPKAFASFQRVAGILGMLAIGCYWFLPPLALALSLLAVMTVVFEFVLYWRFLDAVFPKGESANVLTVIPPAGEAKRRLILCGHMDSAYAFRYNELCPKLLVPLGAFIIAGLLLTALVQAVAVIAGWTPLEGFGLYAGIAQLLLLPAALLGALFNNLNIVAPGANDNLTGAYLAAGVGRLMKKAGKTLDNTELVLMISGAEEAGLRGAKVFAEKHSDWLREKETVFLALDTLRDLEHMHVYSRDMNALVKHDRRVCKMLRQAGEDCGLDLGEAAITIGSSDATAFTQAGIPAAALAAMDPAPAHWYHTSRDDCDLLSPECIARALDVTLAFIERYDAHGLDPA